jgi:DNA-directed RNA polymerase specialized sigma24 family protein
VFADSTMLERLERFHAEQIEDNTQIDRLTECLGKLPHTLRAVLEAKYLHAKECDQIAGEMSRTIQSVYSLVKRAKQLLKACMEQEALNEVS